MEGNSEGQQKDQHYRDTAPGDQSAKGLREPAGFAMCSFSDIHIEIIKNPHI